MAATATCFFFLRPFCVSITRYHSKFPITRKPNFFTPLSSSFSSTPSPEFAAFCTTKSLTNSDTQSLTSLAIELEEEDDDGFEEGISDAIEDNEVVSAVVDEGNSNSISKVKKTKLPLPSLTLKEKKDLASFAHSLGEKLKTQSVGKSGVTDNVVSSFDETLESRELLKIKIHRTCPEELEDVVKQLEESTGSVMVSKIGRTVILYRPSLTKMKAEEKKKQALKVFRKTEKPVFATRQWRTEKPAFGSSSRQSRTEKPAFGARQSRSEKPAFGAGQSRTEKPAFAKNDRAARVSGRGRRGSSRVSVTAIVEES